MTTRIQTLGFVCLLAVPALAQTRFAEDGKVHFPPIEDEILSFATGDVDRDGDIDVVCGNAGRNRLYLNDGHGRFVDATAARLPTNLSWTHGIALLDVDGDLDLDLYEGNGGSPGFQSNQDRLYLNDGTGTFTEVTATALVQDNQEDVRALAFGDLDGDGDLDLVLGTGLSRFSAPIPNKVLLNDGRGRFLPSPGALPAELELCLSVALADVDRDGDLDLVTGYQPSVPTRVYRNNGGAVFTRTGDIPPNAGGAEALALADVDRDGDVDLVCGNHLGSGRGAQNTLYLNDGTGAFQDATSTRLPAVADCTQAVALADLDGDLDLDLVFGNASSGLDRVLLNDGTGTFLEVPAGLPAVANVTNAVALVDVDRDGDADLIRGAGMRCVWPGCGGRIRLHLNVGGFFVDGTVPGRLPEERYPVNDLKLADVDRDGDLDVIAAIYDMNDRTRTRERLYLNDGRGSFTDETAARLPLDNEGTLAVALADVDRDGDPDLLCCNRMVTTGSGPNRLYLNDGRGFFTDVTATHLPAQVYNTACAVFGDVDGDGDLDLVLGNLQLWPLVPNALLLNDGTGRFTEASGRIPANTVSTNAVALGDLDGDGDLDLVVAYEHARNTIYLNNGQGSFSLGTELPPDQAFTLALALGDVDGDRDLDLVCANYLTSVPQEGQNRLYLNDGRGNFSDATDRLPQRSDQSLCVAMGDLDEDGDLDLVFGQDAYPVGAQDNVYLNDGTGRFSDATSAWLPPREEATGGVASGDLDGDGDLDLVAGAWSSTQKFPLRCYINRLRQVTSRVLARVGQPYELEFFGRAALAPAGQIVLPVLSARALAQPLPIAPFGIWRVDPTFGFVLPALALASGSGVASTSLPIPPQTALVGIDLHTQAMVLPGLDPAGWRFTNVEVDRIHP